MVCASHQYGFDPIHCDHNPVCAIRHVFLQAYANWTSCLSYTARNTDAAFRIAPLGRPPYRAISRAFVESAFLAWIDIVSIGLVQILTMPGRIKLYKDSGFLLVVVSTAAYAMLPPVLVSGYCLADIATLIHFS